MKGYEFDPVEKKITFRRSEDSPSLIVPDYTPVLLLPDEVVYNSYNAVFPDVAKSRYFYHTWLVQSASGNYFGAETGYCLVSAVAEEWSQVTALQEAPEDTDIFAAQIRLTRTVAPTHNWLQETIAVMIPQGVWIPLTGSIMLEAALEFSRCLSIYIDDDPESATYRKLVLHQQHSVGPSPGGYGSLGEGEPAALGVPFSFSPHTGGEVVGTGYPVYQGPNVAPQYRTSSGPISASLFSVAVPRNHRASGAIPPSIVDPTNYGATWRLDIRGQFGRRS